METHPSSNHPIFFLILKTETVLVPLKASRCVAASETIHIVIITVKLNNNFKNILLHNSVKKYTVIKSGK